VSAILQLGRNCGAIEVSDRSGVFVDARAYYRAFYRAAQAAQHQILLMGWQFDSGVRLVRGEDAPADAAQPTQLLEFLAWLCERNANLTVYILAWDYSVVFSLEREWLQDRVFSSRHPRIRFRFDDKVATNASQHQKLVVVDGQLAFVGGIDIADMRWDDRDHAFDNSDRRSVSGGPQGPYHDVQTFHVGRAAARLGQLFCNRWRLVVDEPLALESAQAASQIDLGETMVLPCRKVALAETLGSVDTVDAGAVRHIESMYVDAITSAERLIYVETQYLTSRVMLRALIERMRDPHKSVLQLVLILPAKAEALKEEFALGATQSRRLRVLSDVAAQTGHQLGIFYTTAVDAAGSERPTYIHSKLMIVDDDFLTIGSANCTNRSFGFDNELNVAWDVSLCNDTEERQALVQAIADLRRSLLREHCGTAEGHALLERDEQLVARLSAFGEQHQGRLRIHPRQSSALGDNELLRIFATQDWGLDPGARPSALELDLDVLHEATEAQTFFELSLERLQKLVR
jgi:phospholipase D1/2